MKLTNIFLSLLFFPFILYSQNLSKIDAGEVVYIQDNKVYIQAESSLDFDTYEKVTKTIKAQGEIVSSNGYSTSYKIPQHIVGDYFKHLTAIILFDENSKELAKAHFLHIEFYDGSPSTDFYSVYQIEKVSPNQGYYFYISSLLKDHFDVANQKTLEEGNYEKVVLEHYQSNNISLLYDYYSVEAIEINDEVFLLSKLQNQYFIFNYNIETESLKELYRSEENVCFIRFYPFFMDNKLRLLMKELECETDAMWDNVLDMGLFKKNN
ncbi:hypothetical protein KMW28_20765 [Flammeovirga yaeyamensis]|uniref:Plasminogen-binding protein PgbA N-terminal domain-containing protein n=1 Tax=Flammeovirga yaeyamensis TaxID=367791 RepID=A0AAX1NBA9_9BACT|nr:hypothetical protein [Flammeovirga yaeyamensis]MBB3697222.1 hypothetical protein [Flammeovirga yaeyamensis]NMF33881.1 hypothetical protein [Flammeovirga yaeyamensis]QWG04859.1 hypothetical protein KMW28_20765 [Flammeovirga yaeyamensis]